MVAASFISTSFSYVPLSHHSIFQRNSENSTTYIEIAWISSITQTVKYAGGLISSVLVNNYGNQHGDGRGLLYCVGKVAASYNTSVIELYLMSDSLEI